MKRYCIKCRSGKVEYFDIISENEDAYKIKITRLSEGSEKIIEETITRALFDMCLKTGYIFELENPAVSVA